ncbi:uncharacterized protein L969DRAFT_96393 [Mixia osmundae IAM 14324]|uniref:Translation elongation factor EF1B beta/delta subunit guanine nucleotide exchange domain-containing protein n=1 Tax=Mixia osmundae (strain CBS 9802 / IAM 14324 / JCM 22182 / KY 12970) TaxID=764103 RepID=G7DX65_MIXOS|nr:uncharacterized protein L969DRAFT_96393 [Mixia osmundae IAM 14324]KEI37311.1 hypothetical protein L969DRAFT_96393 [Mixia osmundae IAM 14324]GAA95175.1 hypothetical protein E5Q_01830 [Mixia osmundae IAM 14324]
MGFSDLQGSLEQHLSDKSYIEGYNPSQADVAVYKELKSAPDATQYPHAARWYKHLTSYAAEHGSLPGDASKPYHEYGPATASTSKAPAAAAAAADEDDIDLFGSDDEEVDEAAEKLKQERLAAYAAKKANKPKTIAKSVVTLDVKPWDDETDMKELEAAVRSIHKDGLTWGLSKLVPVGYGVSKLQITLVVEDEKISLDDLQDEIAEFEDYVQSSDVQAMQKL